MNVTAPAAGSIDAGAFLVAAAERRLQVLDRDTRGLTFDFPSSHRVDGRGVDDQHAWAARSDQTGSTKHRLCGRFRMRQRHQHGVGVAYEIAHVGGHPSATCGEGCDLANIDIEQRQFHSGVEQSGGEDRTERPDPEQRHMTDSRFHWSRSCHACSS